ncbi:hypothetical protein MYSI104531_27285 [Mycobacterium simiae]
MSGNATSAPGPSIQSANAAADAATRPADFPDTTNVDTSVSEPAAATGAGSGPSSITTCAFVPPSPNEETAARRGPESDGHGVFSTGTNSRVGAASIAGFHWEKCRFGGIWPRCTASTALMKPATPDAASRWPMLVFTAPSAQRPSPRP